MARWSRRTVGDGTTVWATRCGIQYEQARDMAGVLPDLVDAGLVLSSAALEVLDPVVAWPASVWRLPDTFRRHKTSVR